MWRVPNVVRLASGRNCSLVPRTCTYSPRRRAPGGCRRMGFWFTVGVGKSLGKRRTSCDYLCLCIWPWDFLTNTMVVCVGWVRLVHMCSNVFEWCGSVAVGFREGTNFTHSQRQNFWGMSVVGWLPSVRAACRTRKLLLKRQQNHKETRGTSKCRRSFFYFRFSACQLLQVICLDGSEIRLTSW